MKTKEGVDITFEYVDKDSHGLCLEVRGMSVFLTLSKEDMNQLIQELIRYTQGNPDWKGEY